MAGKFALLADRGVVEVSGGGAGAFLQGLVTNDIDGLAPEKKATHAALLSPQGKIITDFVIVRAPAGYLLDVPRAMAGDLIKKLSMYRLRAKIDIRDASDEWAVAVFWEHSPEPALVKSPAIVFEDPRFASLGWRALIPADLVNTLQPNASEAEYHTYRIGHGIPEGGKDYAFGDAFPHEALMDKLGGVSFTKGCYVGQEIVSRMEHRGTARKRIVPIVASGPLPAQGTDVRAGDVAIGSLCSIADQRALALIRLDRAAEFEAKGVPLNAGSTAIRIALPPWARFAITPAD